jgi:hypothetical protein
MTRIDAFLLYDQLNLVVGVAWYCNREKLLYCLSKDQKCTRKASEYVRSDSGQVRVIGWLGGKTD